MFISLIEISKSYSNKGIVFPILKNINLEIMKGEKIAIMGKNGAGKTTLLNIIATIDIPDNGDYIFKDKKLAVDSMAELNKLRRSYFGYIPQGFCLIRDKSVFYNISLPLLFQGLGKVYVKEKVEAVASYLKIEHLLNKMPRDISLGECQKVSIARALILEPEIMLADEITNNLDDEAKNIALDVITNPKELTTIIVTHDPQVAKRCDRILYLCDGTISHLAPS